MQFRNVVESMGICGLPGILHVIPKDWYSRLRAHISTIGEKSSDGLAHTYTWAQYFSFNFLNEHAWIMSQGDIPL